MQDTQFLYLTTQGRKTGLPREIEIWFVEEKGKYYIIAEHGENAQWVKNIRHHPRIHVRVGNLEFDAIARVLDEKDDWEAWDRARQMEMTKYGWDEGLPVEITPG